MNSLVVIFPYKRHGVWAFDDPSAGLAQEPFVSGMPEMIEALVKEIPDAENGFMLLFSAFPFPGHDGELVWLREDGGGNWYRETRTGLEGWLCPALYQYFKQGAPKRLYCAARAKLGQR
jgi:Family of unknown function (DUF6717)